MTEINGGGITITEFKYKNTRFKRDVRKLTNAMTERLSDKLKDIIKKPMPPGLRFEKLGGYSNPDIYTFHLTGNYKVSLELEDGSTAVLRRVGPYDYIDRTP